MISEGGSVASILVIDDDELMRTFLIESFKDKGYVVRPAKNGQLGKDCKAPSSMNTGGSPSDGATSLHKDSLKLHSNASSASTTTNGHISNTEPKDEHPQRSSGELKGGPVHNLSDSRWQEVRIRHP